MFSRAPQLTVIAGVNGSGKTTLYNRLRPVLPGLAEAVYINPDEIARELSPHDIEQAAMQAGKRAIRAQSACLREGKSFVIETTLSGHREVSLIARAHQAGFRTCVVYMFLKDVVQSAARVAARVRAGGHHIPWADLSRRWQRSLDNLVSAVGVADRCYLLFNGMSAHRCEAIIADRRLVWEAPRQRSRVLRGLNIQRVLDEAGGSGVVV
jgi:predicted ABC-type ATPase